MVNSLDWGPVEQARQQSQSAQQSATEFESKGYTLADQLRQAIGAKFGETGIPQATATARANYMAAPAQIRSDIAGQVRGGTIFSPSQQQALMASKMGSALVPLSAANIIQSAGYGTLEDMIGAGTRAWQAQTAQKQGAAQLAQTNYANILNELTTRANIKEPEQGYTVNIPGIGPMKLSSSQALEYAMSKQKAGAGGGGLDLSSLLGLLNNQKVDVSTDHGAGPQYSPTTGMGSTVKDDSGVIWEFTQDFKWHPIGRM